MDGPSIVVENLDFSYGGTTKKILSNVSFTLDRGSRCLLLGRNGTGKSTLLRLMAGKHYIGGDEIRVLGRNAYHQTPIGLTFLGGDWAHNPNVRKDIRVQQLLNSMNAQAHGSRQDHLLELLDIDPEWRMHQVSDGERRRVQLLLGLIEPFSVLLLDEVTIDLDVLVRQDLLRFLRDETEQRGATIVYATHILDGLNEWPTHLLHLNNGRIGDGRVHSMNDLNVVERYAKSGSLNSPLLQLAEDWLRKELEERRRIIREQQQKKDETAQKQPDLMTKLAYSDKTDKYYNYWNGAS